MKQKWINLTFTCWRNVTFVASLHHKSCISNTSIIPISRTLVFWFKASSCPRFIHNCATYIFCVRYKTLGLQSHTHTRIHLTKWATATTDITHRLLPACMHVALFFADQHFVDSCLRLCGMLSVNVCQWLATSSHPCHVYKYYAFLRQFPNSVIYQI